MRWTIGKKLVGLSSLSVLVMLAVGWMGYYSTSQLNTKMDEILTMNMALRNHMQADMMHDALRADALRALYSAQHRPEDKAEIESDLARHSSEFREMLEANEKLVLHPAVKEALRKVRPNLETYLKTTEEIVPLAFRDQNAASAQLAEFFRTFLLLEKDLGDLSELISDAAQQAQKDGQLTAASAYRWIGVSTFLMLCLLTASSIWIARGIVRSLTQTVTVLRDIAHGEGDLSRRLNVTGSDELGELAQWFNSFMDQLHQIINQVRETSEHVAGAAKDLSSVSGGIASGTQQQASSLEETAASLEEMTGTVKQNAENARHANQLAVGSRDVAEKGGQVVSAAVAAMDAITKSSKKINEISTVIDEIAFQTNLLALNAAVEAARAGEQGRGFAVVAAEVRNLAQRSAAAAKEIKGLIQDSGQKVEDGVSLVTESGQTLGEIVTSVKRVTDIIGDIAAASQEQSAGIEQVNRAVMQMDQVVQENATQTEELTSMSQSLAMQADQLHSLVRQFKLSQESGSQKLERKPEHSVKVKPQLGKRRKVERPYVNVTGHMLQSAKVGLEQPFEEF